MNKIPTALSDKILNDIHEKLHPKISHLIAKVFVIHFMTAAITLSVCPQFGFKLFKLPVNLMNTFMVFGMPVCNFLCGLFFTATSIGVASLVLKRDEVRSLKFQKTLLSLALILSSIGFFWIMNPQMFLEFSVLWLIGALVGVMGTLEVFFGVRAKVN
jgi:hypothetical protein